jgi:hypothetical protein
LGIWTGQASANNAADLEGSEVLAYPRDWLAIPSSTLTSDIVEYFNALYKTPANRDIRWEWAYTLAAMNARDDNTNDRQALLSFLRQYGSLPTYGQLVGVKAADVITIRANQGEFDVHLAGVTSAGMSEAQRTLTVSFLRGLVGKIDFMNATPCSKPTNVTVSLSYHSLFFRERMLSPTVAILSARYKVLCLGTRAVPLSTLSPSAPTTGVDQVNLNWSLVRWGLALPDTMRDPKVPDNIADWDNYDDVAKLAKSDGLYIYGNGRDPTIDEVIAAGSAPHPAN